MLLCAVYVVGEIASPGHRKHTDKNICDWKLNPPVPDPLTSRHTGNPVPKKGPQALGHFALQSICICILYGAIPA